MRTASMAAAALTLTGALAGAPVPDAAAQDPPGFVGSVTFANPRSDAGDLGRAFVIRDAKPLPVSIKKLLQEGDMTQNIYLQPDDLIYLPSSSPSEIYVLGAVNNPRAVRIAGTPTLVSAIAAAGGTAEMGYLSDVAVVRGGVTDPAIAVSNVIGTVSPALGDFGPATTSMARAPRWRAASALYRRSA